MYIVHYPLLNVKRKGKGIDTMTEKEAKEILNDGYVIKEHRQNAIHKFCAAVKYVSEKCGFTTTQGYDYLRDRIINFSHARAKETEIKPIGEHEDILSYLFNPKEDIPVRIIYWIDVCYDYRFGSAVNYKGRHYDVYNELQRKYIDIYRANRASEKEDRQIRKEQRRKICQLYKSGKYTAVFELYGKPLKSSFETAELDNAYDLLVELFGADLGELSVMNIAAAYMIGVLQGRRDNENSGELPAAGKRS